MTNFNSRPALLSLAAIVLVAASAEAAEPGAVRAPIQRIHDRKPAPDFGLEDAAGKVVRLSNYRGKVVLLDFWATECGGCVREIPWFMDLARAYKKKGLAVTGVSVDILYEDLKDSQEAWRRVKPFVQTHQVNYPILMGDDQVTKPYDIQALPATYLIDKRGRIAATYIGLVDKENLEANIQAVLKEHGRQ
jgi:peroxiredoxin